MDQFKNICTIWAEKCTLWLLINKAKKMRTKNNHGGIVKTESNSVFPPSAQSITLCGFPGEVLYRNYIVTVIAQARKSRGETFAAFVDLLAANGLRVSEALAVRGSDCLFNGQVRIKGKKGSKDRLATTIESSEYFIQQTSNNGLIFASYNRWFVYRELQKLGIRYQSSGSTNVSITHAFRHMFVKHLRQLGYSDAEIAKIVGHVNVSNTELYGK